MTAYYCSDCADTYDPYDGWLICDICESCRDRLAEKMASDEEDDE